MYNEINSIIIIFWHWDVHMKQTRFFSESTDLIPHLSLSAYCLIFHYLFILSLYSLSSLSVRKKSWCYDHLENLVSHNFVLCVFVLNITRYRNLPCVTFYLPPTNVLLVINLTAIAVRNVSKYSLVALQCMHQVIGA